MQTASSNQDQIARNIEVHNRVAEKYDATHGEIFNPVEQQRLADSLAAAKAAIRTGAEPPRALDFGCGSGNLTRHLLGLGFEVTAADVTPHFLSLVEGRFAGAPVTTLRMNGTDLTELPDGSFDMVATYSVLHHVPDYLLAVREMGRVCRRGGVVYIDHEPTEGYWTPDETYRRFQAEGARFDWRKYLRPSNYVHKVRRLFNPRHTNEGDIHVFPDDHVEWAKVTALLEEQGFEVVLRSEYLLFRDLYRPEVYERYRDRCTDNQCMIFRKL